MKIEHYKEKYYEPFSGAFPTPFTPEQGLERIHKICMCEGAFDCDCVSAVNEATVKLWTERKPK